MTTQDDDAVEQQGEEEQQTPSCAAEQTKAAAMRLKGEEDMVRKKAKRNPMFLFLVNSVATIFVFIFHLISLEGIVSLALSVSLTVYLYNKESTSNEDRLDGMALSWTLLSFAVVSPINLTVSMAFNRREQALISIARFRSTCIEMYAAQACWSWPGRDRSTVDWLKHSDEYLAQILSLSSHLERYLTLPNSSRARHKMLKVWQREAQETLAVAAHLYEEIIDRLSTMAEMTEITKREGLPGNEAARIRQWEIMVLEETEKLRMIKVYRTPQSLRSFGRLFSVLLPPFYAPYYSELATSLNSLAMGIAFACLTSLALTGLFESGLQMEDPFIRSSLLDGVQVGRELTETFQPRLFKMRKHFFPNAKPFDALPKVEPAQERMGSVYSGRLWSED